MKILHVITGLDNGGAEAALYRLAVGDSQNAHEVVSLTGRGVYAERLVTAEIRTHTLSMPRGRITLSGISKLYRLMRATRPDVVQTWMYHADLLGGVLARLSGVKIVVWGIRGPFDKQKTGFQTKLAVKLCALISRWVPDAIVCNSARAVDAHVQAGYVRHKFVNIPNGYPLGRFRPDATARAQLRAELGVNERVPLIGMVARFDPHKDHENLFAALSLVTREGGRIACVLVGAGMSADNHQVMELIAKYGIGDHVVLLGARDDVPKIMAALDVHVLSSAAESFPNVVAEAMACGTPCITTDVGDAALIVGNVGWVVPCADPAALAEAILSAVQEMNDAVKSRARREACRKHISDNYSLERMIVSYTRVWGNSVVAG